MSKEKNLFPEKATSTLIQYYLFGYVLYLIGLQISFVSTLCLLEIFKNSIVCERYYQGEQKAHILHMFSVLKERTSTSSNAKTKRQVSDCSVTFNFNNGDYEK